MELNNKNISFERYLRIYSWSLLFIALGFSLAGSIMFGLSEFENAALWLSVGLIIATLAVLTIGARLIHSNQRLAESHQAQADLSRQVTSLQDQVKQAWLVIFNLQRKLTPIDEPDVTDES